MPKKKSDPTAANVLQTSRISLLQKKRAREVAGRLTREARALDPSAKRVTLSTVMRLALDDYCKRALGLTGRPCDDPEQVPDSLRGGE